MCKELEIFQLQKVVDQPAKMPTFPSQIYIDNFIQKHTILQYYLLDKKNIIKMT